MNTDASYINTSVMINTHREARTITCTFEASIILYTYINVYRIHAYRGIDV